MKPGGACTVCLWTVADGPVPDPVADGTTTDAVVSVAGTPTECALTCDGAGVLPAGGKGNLTIPEETGGTIDTWTLVPVIFLTTFE